MVALVASLTFPERLAQAQGGDLMLNGTRADIGDGSALRGAPWLAVTVADRPVGAGHARVRLAAVVDEETARRAAAPLHTEGDEVHWADGDVVARRGPRTPRGCGGGSGSCGCTWATPGRRVRRRAPRARGRAAGSRSSAVPGGGPIWRGSTPGRR